MTNHTTTHQKQTAATKAMAGRMFALLALLAVFTLIAAAPGRAESLRYGGQYYPGEFVLQGQPGLWKDAGVDVQHILFSSGTENNQALVSGKVDVNCGSDSKTSGLFGVMGDKAVILATIQKGDRYATVVRKDANYKTWQDLKGQTVATRLGSGAEQVLRRYFDSLDGVSWSDFKWVNLKIENMASALRAGNIEAFTAWEPTPAIAEARGIGKVMRTYGDVSQVPVSLHTTRTFAEAHRETIVRFLMAHLAKAELIATNPGKAAEMAAAAAGKSGRDVPADAFLRIFKRIDFGLDVTDAVKQSIKGTATFLHAKGKLPEVPEFSYDPSFLEEAKKRYAATK